MGIIFSLFYFFLAYIIGKFYEERGLNFYLGFFISLFFSPVFAIILGFLLPINYLRIKRETIFKTEPKVTESFKFEEAEVSMKEEKQETLEEREKRLKKEKRFLLIAVIGTIVFVVGFFFFVKKQIDFVRKMDLKYRHISTP